MMRVYQTAVPLSKTLSDGLVPFRARRGRSKSCSGAGLNLASRPRQVRALCGATGDADVLICSDSVLQRVEHVVQRVNQLREITLRQRRRQGVPLTLWPSP